MNKKLRLGLVITVAVLLSLAAGVVFAGNSWSKYHWDISTAESIAAPLAFGDNLTTIDWTISLGRASTDWNESVLKNAVTAGFGTCDPVRGRVEVCNAEYGQNGWLGIAQVWIYRGRAGHIAQGLVKVNDTYFNMTQYNSQAWRDYVVCQEVGHTLGLGHQDEILDNANLGSCMDYTDDPDGMIDGQADNRFSNQHDRDVLTEKYAHLNPVDDGGETGGSGPGKGNGKGKKDKAPGQQISQWGKAINVDGKGRPNLFELNLGNGDKMFTHVFWAD